MNRLLILAPNWLGDAVMALPAIADVRRAAPDVSIAVAARPSIAPLFGMVGDVNDVIMLEARPRTYDVAGWRKLGAELRDRRFEAALLLPNSFHAALMAARGRIPERWGYRAQWRGPLLTRGVDPAPSGMHRVDYYQRLVQAIGFPNGPAAPRLDLSPDLRDAGARALSDVGWDRRIPLVALAPGAAYGGAKQWPAASFAELAQALASDGVAVVVVGSSTDQTAGRQIMAGLAAGVSVFNLIGRTDLPGLTGVLANCRALVGNDSGATFLGAALGVSVTALFGPTHERVSAPRGESHLEADGAPDIADEGRGVRLQPDRGPAHAVLTHPVWCRPCWLRECPLDHRCMRGIGVDAVLAAVRRAL